jgi:hypothetical protein
MVFGAFATRGAAAQGDVPPMARVTIRQLRLGSTDTVQRFAGDWIAAMPAAAQLRDELRSLALQVGVSGVGSDAVYVQRVEYGIDSAARAAAIEVLQQAIDSSADSILHGLFSSPDGAVFDSYDRAVATAHEYLVGFSLDSAVRGLHALGLLTVDSSAASVRAAVMALHRAPGATPLLDSLVRLGDRRAESLHALIAAQSESRPWWLAAVRALLTRPWLATTAGWRSPAQLMAQFWGVDSLPLPRIVANDLQGEFARPVIDGRPLLVRLLRPDNAAAAAWLAADGTSRTFAFWRALDWGAPLPVRVGRGTVLVLSPAQLAHASPALFGTDDEVLVDPSVTPLAAVAIIVHEWQHLVTAQRRFGGARPLALDNDSLELRVRDANPWLAEGLAEWATDQVLRRAGRPGAWLRFTQAGKRVALADDAPDDPHLLGYQLVEALAAHASADRVRDRLVAALSDPAALAREFGLATSRRAPAREVLHAATATVIPEVSFRSNGADFVDVTHRLLIFSPRLEP